MPSVLLLLACAGSDPSPLSTVVAPAALPSPPGDCDWTVLDAIELSPPHLRSGASTATRTQASRNDTTLEPPGEIEALLEHEGALWLALGSAGVGRWDAEGAFAHWPVSGEVVGLGVDGGMLWAADRTGQLVGLPTDATVDTPLEHRPVDTWPDAVGFEDGQPVAVRAEAAPAPRITALAASTDAVFAATVEATGPSLVQLRATPSGLRIDTRVGVDAEITDLAWLDGRLLVSGAGLQTFEDGRFTPFALDGEDVAGVAVHDEAVAAWTPTRGLVALDSAGEIHAEVPPPKGVSGTGVAFFGSRPVAVTSLYGTLLGVGLERALPMPASRVRGHEGALWIAMPEAGVAELRDDGPFVRHPTWPGARDVMVHDDTWIAAVGTHGLVSGSGQTCDLSGTTRRLARLDARRILVASGTRLSVVATDGRAGAGPGPQAPHPTRPTP